MERLPSITHIHLLFASNPCWPNVVLLNMPLQPSILKTIAYFDLFDYPVTAAETRFFLGLEAGADEVEEALENLVKERYLFRTGIFYSLKDDPRLVDRRLRGNRHAEELLQIAERISGFLYQFPYVRGIGISGSLSKNFADEDADIDYFIITRANRLWIARTIMHFFKKLSFLRGHQHWYCMNYYVDEEALEIEEKNIFTATELISLMPIRGNGGLVKFFNANDWATSFLPQYAHRQREAPGNPRFSIFKRALERLFDNRLGDWLDDFLCRLTSRRWLDKEQKGQLTRNGYKMSLLTGKHFSRPNPAMLQRRILTIYQHKLEEMEIKWEKLVSSES